MNVSRQISLHNDLLSATYLHVLFIAATESCHCERAWHSGHDHLMFLFLCCDFVFVGDVEVELESDDDEVDSEGVGMLFGSSEWFV